MTYEEALSKKQVGDMRPVAEICGITHAHARLLLSRPNAKKYKMVMDALILVIENREKLISKLQKSE